MNPITEWNAQLQQCRLDVEMKRKWERRLEQLNTELKKQQRTVEDSQRLLEKEQADVEKLASSSFSHFWLGLLGKLDEKLGVEEKEAAEAKLKHDSAAASLQRLEEEKADVIRRFTEVDDADRRLNSLKQAKETWIRDHDEATATELEKLSGRMAAVQAKLVDTKEAVSAGNQALQALASAEDRLGSAKNWGTYDMLGGGMIATMIKHGRIDEAREHIYEASHQLRRFAEELKDLQMQAETDSPQIGSFLTFADYFFDGFISDWIVQGRIHDSIESVRSQQSRVDAALHKLEQLQRQLESEAAGCRSLSERFVEQYGA